MVLILIVLIIVSFGCVNYLKDKTDISLDEKLQNTCGISKQQIVEEIIVSNELCLIIKTGIEDKYSSSDGVVTIKNYDDTSLQGIINIIDILAIILTPKIRIKKLGINLFQFGAAAVFVVFYVFTNGEQIELFWVAFILLSISLVQRVMLYRQQKKIKVNTVLDKYHFTTEEQAYILKRSEQLDVIRAILTLAAAVFSLVLFRVYLLS